MCPEAVQGDLVISEMLGDVKENPSNSFSSMAFIISELQGVNAIFSFKYSGSKFVQSSGLACES